MKKMSESVGGTLMNSMKDHLTKFYDHLRREKVKPHVRNATLPPSSASMEGTINRVFNVPELDIASHLCLIFAKSFLDIQHRDILTCHQHQHHERNPKLRHLEVRRSFFELQ